jgi:hypothetical protein
VLVSGQDRRDAGRRSARRLAEETWVGTSVTIEGRNLDRLAALRVDDL